MISLFVYKDMLFQKGVDAKGIGGAPGMINSKSVKVRNSPERREYIDEIARVPKETLPNCPKGENK
jgi:hypothetical protein